MAQQSFVTRMPDKSGAFLRASRIIAGRGGNIIRVSYNKAVDPHTLFVDVEARDETLRKIEEDLHAIGYIDNRLEEIRVIEVSVRIPDRPGAVLPVLEVFGGLEVNISYMNSRAQGGAHQDFKFGLLIRDPANIKILLDQISAIYPVDIVECDSAQESLDNTVFYIRLANEMKTLLHLGRREVTRFIVESNRILQHLQSGGESAGKVFDHIRRFARFVSACRGENYRAQVQRIQLSASVALYSIQPQCGSNAYLFDAPGEAVLLDTGYAIYFAELEKLLRQLMPDWDAREKRVYITHADVDHCGLLSGLPGARIWVNQKSAENFQRQLAGLPDYREQTELHMGYSRISRIISGYRPPGLGRLSILDENTPREHDALLPIGTMTVGDLDFTILEGSGGHLFGEMVYACRQAGAVFTGDILLNIGGFSEERAEFNALAPYLMKSVNVDSDKAAEMRRQTAALIDAIARENNRPCLVLGGHGPICEMRCGKLVNA